MKHRLICTDIPYIYTLQRALIYPNATRMWDRNVTKQKWYKYPELAIWSADSSNISVYEWHKMHMVWLKFNQFVIIAMISVLHESR